MKPQFLKTLWVSMFVVWISLVATAGELPISTIINPDGSIKPNIEGIVTPQHPATFVNENGEPIFTMADDIEGQV